MNFNFVTGAPKLDYLVWLILTQQLLDLVQFCFQSLTLCYHTDQKDVSDYRTQRKDPRVWCLCLFIWQVIASYPWNQPESSPARFNWLSPFPGRNHTGPLLEIVAHAKVPWLYLQSNDTQVEAKLDKYQSFILPRLLLYLLVYSLILTYYHFESIKIKIFISLPILWTAFYLIIRSLHG